MNFPLHIARRYIFANNAKGIILVFMILALFIAVFISFMTVDYQMEDMGLLAIQLTLRVVFFIGIIVGVFIFRKRIRSLNAINIISGISVFGITVGSAALILILSVFNGFEDLITSMFGAFNPDLKVTPAKGKTFSIEESQIDQLLDLEGVVRVAQSLEEIAFFEYDKIQDFGILKGVDQYYNEVVNIDSSIIEGQYGLKEEGRFLAILGAGMRNKLSVNVRDEFSAMRVYMPKQGRVSQFDKPYRSRLIQPVGTFYIQQEFDSEYILTDLEFARELLKAPGEVSALEIKMEEGFDDREVKEQIRSILGEAFVVKNRFEQDEAFLKLMNLEKWMGFAILSFTLILVAFNMVGALWMIVIDKKRDVAILKSMGTTDPQIWRIFALQGILLTAVGLVIGLLLAVVFYVAQKMYGLIPIPEGFIINAYPISLKAVDFLIVVITVLVIGGLASIPAAYRALRIPATIREE